jgi:serine/threonine protein kinase
MHSPFDTEAYLRVLCCGGRYVAADYTQTQIKISDFGLTVNAYTATAQYLADGPKPIRYLAPEALRKNRYSEKSDVWAFGVAAWELLTDGDVPFYDIETDVVRHIAGGGKLATPTTADTDTMWAAVQPCFALSPRDRPTFAQLGVSLGQVVVRH